MYSRQKKNSSKQRETSLEGLASTCSVLTIGLFVLTFMFQNFLIPSSSMASTLLVGDHVVVERETLTPKTPWAPFLRTRDIQRGDIVVFWKPTLEPDGTHLFLVKRVIGIPGDRLHLRDGVVYLNGIAQYEPQAARPTPADYDAYIDEFPSVSALGQPRVAPNWPAVLAANLHGDDLVVPAGQYFVMGDNRQISLDSRYWGFVPRENILGRPLFVYWSIVTPEGDAEEAPASERASSDFDEAIHFFDRTRWRRTFHRIQ
jgi:signal peptidase I